MATVQASVQGHMSISAFTASRDGCLADPIGKATTLMFRHLPRKHTARDLLSILAQHVTQEAFDFVYVPWDKNSTSNMGYAFVNFVDSPTARMIAATMQRSIWPNDPRMREMRILPACVQGLAANLMRYNDTVAEPDLTHCPLVFRRGREIPLQVALQQCSQMQPAAAPQWNFKESSMHLGHQSAPARGMVPPPPGLSAEDLSVDALDTWSSAGTSAGGPPSPAPGYMPVVSEHHSNIDQLLLLKGSCREVALDASTFASSASVASTMSTASTASTKTRQLESPRSDIVLESPAYAAASLKVDDLLMKLRQAGAF